MPYRADTGRPQGGMTLIEVLVAMLILGTAAASLLALVGQHTRNMDAMRENLLSRIAAENVMVETMLNEGQDVRDNAGTTDLAGRSYDWRVIRQQAPLEGLEVVTVEIRAAGPSDRLLASLSTLGPESRP